MANGTEQEKEALRQELRQMIADGAPREEIVKYRDAKLSEIEGKQAAVQQEGAPVQQGEGISDDSDSNLAPGSSESNIDPFTGKKLDVDPETQKALKDPKDIGAWENFKNNVSNVMTRIYGFDNRLDLVTADIYEKLLGKEAADKMWAAMPAYDPETGEWIESTDELRANAYRELAETQAAQKQTIGLIDAWEEGSPTKIISAAAGAGLNMVSTLITSGLTLGAGLYTDMVGDAIYDANTEKAKANGMTVQELYESGGQEFETPAMVGIAGGMLERLGSKGVANYIGGVSKKLAGEAGKKAATMINNMGKEGMTEWLQTGLETYNREFGKGNEDAPGVALDTMFSREGLEAALQGAIGAGVGGGAGKGARHFVNKAAERAGVLPKGETPTADMAEAADDSDYLFDAKDNETFYKSQVQSVEEARATLEQDFDETTPEQRDEARGVIQEAEAAKRAEETKKRYTRQMVQEFNEEYDGTVENPTEEGRIAYVARKLGEVEGVDTFDEALAMTKAKNRDALKVVSKAFISARTPQEAQLVDDINENLVNAKKALEAAPPGPTADALGDLVADYNADLANLYATANRKVLFADPVAVADAIEASEEIANLNEQQAAIDGAQDLTPQVKGKLLANIEDKRAQALEKGEVARQRIEESSSKNVEGTNTEAKYFDEVLKEEALENTKSTDAIIGEALGLNLFEDPDAQPVIDETLAKNRQPIDVVDGVRHYGKRIGGNFQSRAEALQAGKQTELSAKQKGLKTDITYTDVNPERPGGETTVEIEMYKPREQDLTEAVNALKNQEQEGELAEEGVQEEERTATDYVKDFAPEAQETALGDGSIFLPGEDAKAAGAYRAVGGLKKRGHKDAKFEQIGGGFLVRPGERQTGKQIEYSLEEGPKQYEADQREDALEDYEDARLDATAAWLRENGNEDLATQLEEGDVSVGELDDSVIPQDVQDQIEGQAWDNTLGAYEAQHEEGDVEYSIDEAGRAHAADGKFVPKSQGTEVARVKALPLEAEDGATFNLDGTVYEDGGLVVPIASKNMKASELTNEAIENFKKKYSNYMGPSSKVGIYKFPGQDQVSIDLNVIAPSSMREQALKIGRSLGQESLFDLDTFENIKTGQTGANPKTPTAAQAKNISNQLSDVEFSLEYKPAGKTAEGKIGVAPYKRDQGATAKDLERAGINEADIIDKAGPGESYVLEDMDRSSTTHVTGESRKKDAPGGKGGFAAGTAGDVREKAKVQKAGDLALVSEQGKAARDFNKTLVQRIKGFKITDPEARKQLLEPFGLKNKGRIKRAIAQIMESAPESEYHDYPAEVRSLTPADGLKLMQQLYKTQDFIGSGKITKSQMDEANSRYDEMAGYRGAHNNLDSTKRVTKVPSLNLPLKKYKTADQKAAEKLRLEKTPSYSREAGGAQTYGRIGRPDQSFTIQNEAGEIVPGIVPIMDFLKGEGPTVYRTPGRPTPKKAPTSSPFDPKSPRFRKEFLDKLKGAEPSAKVAFDKFLKTLRDKELTDADIAAWQAIKDIDTTEEGFRSQPKTKAPLKSTELGRAKKIKDAVTKTLLNKAQLFAKRAQREDKPKAFEAGQTSEFVRNRNKQVDEDIRQIANTAVAEAISLGEITIPSRDRKGNPTTRVIPFDPSNASEAQTALNFAIKDAVRSYYHGAGAPKGITNRLNPKSQTRLNKIRKAVKNIEQAQGFDPQYANDPYVIAEALNEGFSVLERGKRVHVQDVDITPEQIESLLDSEAAVQGDFSKPYDEGEGVFKTPLDDVISDIDKTEMKKALKELQGGKRKGVLKSLGLSPADAQGTLDQIAKKLNIGDIQDNIGKIASAVSSDPDMRRKIANYMRDRFIDNPKGKRVNRDFKQFVAKLAKAEAQGYAHGLGKTTTPSQELDFSIEEGSATRDTDLGVRSKLQVNSHRQPWNETAKELNNTIRKTDFSKDWVQWSPGQLGNIQRGRAKGIPMHVLRELNKQPARVAKLVSKHGLETRKDTKNPGVYHIYKPGEIGSKPDFSVEEKRASTTRPTMEYRNAVGNALKKAWGTNRVYDQPSQWNAKVYGLKLSGVQMPFERVKGLMHAGAVYLNPSAMTKDTPIHEFAHIWAKELMRNNPKLWKRGKDLLKGSDYARAVYEIPTYRKYLKDNPARFWEEVMANAIGKRGAVLFENRQKASAWDRWMGAMTKWLKNKLGISAEKDYMDLTLDDWLDVGVHGVFTGKAPTPAKAVEYSIKTPEGKAIIESELEKRLSARAAKKAPKKGWFSRATEWMVPPAADDYHGLVQRFNEKFGKDPISKKLKSLTKDYVDGYEQFEKDATKARENFAKAGDKLAEKLNLSVNKFQKLIGDTPRGKLDNYLAQDSDVNYKGVPLSINEAIGVYLNPGSFDANLVDQVRNTLPKEILEFADNLEFTLEPGQTLQHGLLQHINKNVFKDSMSKFLDNKNKNFNRDVLNDIGGKMGSKYQNALEDSLNRMGGASGRPTDAITQKWNDWLNNSVGAIMFLNVRSAVLQGLSIWNYMSPGNMYTFNKDLAGIMSGKFGKDTPQFKQFQELWNDPMLKERRARAGFDVNASEVMDAVKTGNLGKLTQKALNKGFVLTSLMDSVAIAAGGTAFVRQEMSGGKKSKQEALRAWREKTQEAQQSARPDRVSQQQKAAVSKFILAFANTPAQYFRLSQKAYRTIKAKGLTSPEGMAAARKIAYYMAIQNAIFTMAQSASTALFTGWGGEDDEQKEAENALNSMISTGLRGMGLYGAVLSAAKDAVLNANRESKKKNPKYSDAIIKGALQVSPPLNRKINQIQGIGRAYTYKQERSKTGLRSPHAVAVGKGGEALFNLPTDWFQKKLAAFQALYEGDANLEEFLWMLGGYSEYSVLGKGKDEFDIGDLDIDLDDIDIDDIEIDF